MGAKHENNSSVLGGIIGLVIVGLLGWWVYNTWLKPDYWQGVYETTVSNSVYATEKMSKEECMDWLVEARANPGERYNFECGSNCKPPTTELGVYVCESTFD